MLFIPQTAECLAVFFEITRHWFWEWFFMSRLPRRWSWNNHVMEHPCHSNVACGLGRILKCQQKPHQKRSQGMFRRQNNQHCSIYIRILRNLFSLEIFEQNNFAQTSTIHCLFNSLCGTQLLCSCLKRYFSYSRIKNLSLLYWM